MLRRLFPQRIALKLGLIIGLFIIILVSVLGLVFFRITHHALTSTIKESYKAIAVRAAQETSLFVNRPVELLNTVGSLIGRIERDPWKYETLLVEMSLTFPMFEEILAVDREGRVIASSNPGRPTKGYATEPSFLEAVKGKAYLSAIRIEEDYLPHVTIALPYYQRGRAGGVLIADVNLRGMWEIVDAMRIGNTGRAFLISKKGLLIAHPDKKLVLRNTDFSSYPAFRRALSIQSGNVEYRDEGKKVQLASFASVPGPLPLVIVIQIEGKEAYHLLRQTYLLVWLVLGVSLLVSMAVGFSLAKWLVQPVKALQLWSKRVAVGDFDYRIPPVSLDELGRLFIHFRRMSMRLKEAREKERLAALGEAASTISHKLKNSIVSLKTFSQLLPERKQDMNFLQKFEKDFSSTIDHLEKMFGNLAQVASSHKPMIEPVDLRQLFKRIQIRYLETTAKMGIEFHAEIDPGLPLVYGDISQLEDLIVNLVQNAIQAMPLKGGRIVFQAGRNPVSGGMSSVRISVGDNGIGIPKENFEKIFKPFFTTKHGGMGLGLAICKKIVEDHNGLISLSSVEGKGTTFVVQLPVQAKVSTLTPLTA